MSGYDYQRPGGWETAGDHERRIRALEALPCCANSMVDSGAYRALVLANPCLYAYWPMNDAGPGATDIFGGLDLAENPAGSSFGQPLGTQGSFAFAYEQEGPFADVPEATAIGFDGNDLTNANGTLLWATAPVGNPFAGDFSMVGWVYAADTSLNGLWDLYTGTGNRVGLETALSPRKFNFAMPGGSIVSTTTVATATWFFVGCVYDATADDMFLYVNGALEATDTSAGPPGSAGTLRFGAAGEGASGPSNFLSGRQSQYAWFNCVLTADEIAELYAATSTGSVPATGGLVATADGSGGYTWEYPTIEVLEDGV